MEEGLTKQTCPGEDNCAVFQSSVNPERSCKTCPKNLSKTNLSDIEGAFAVLPWLNHVIWVYNLIHVGAVFHINDLSMDEWNGVRLLKAVESEVEAEAANKERVKAQAARVLQAAKK